MHCQVQMNAFEVCNSLFDKYQLYMVARRRPMFCERYTRTTDRTDACRPMETRL